MQAAANAKNNLGLRAAKLYVCECSADGGPQLKRVRPRAKGRWENFAQPCWDTRCMCLRSSDGVFQSPRATCFLLACSFSVPLDALQGEPHLEAHISHDH